MAKLIYSAITSLDGYVADENGNFDWAAPDEEVHRLVNDLERPVGTYLYGRRMYEVMVVWEIAHTLADQSPVVQDFAEIWQAADKIVYSKTLETASSARTRIERDFDPDAVLRMKASAGRDLTVGGPDLAAQAIKAGLVDDLHLFITPVVVGGGKQSLPNNVRLKLELLDERRFGNGVVHLTTGTEREEASKRGSCRPYTDESGCPDFPARCRAPAARVRPDLRARRGALPAANGLERRPGLGGWRRLRRAPAHTEGARNRDAADLAPRRGRLLAADRA